MHGSAVTMPPANSLGLGSKICSKHFTLNNTCRFLIIFLKLLHVVFTCLSSLSCLKTIYNTNYLSLGKTIV